MYSDERQSLMSIRKIIDFKLVDLIETFLIKVLLFGIKSVKGRFKNDVTAKMPNFRRHLLPMIMTT